VQVSQAYKSPSGLIVATIEIPLTRGYVTRIYETDRVFTDGRKWHAATSHRRKSVYACTKIDGRHVYLHKLLCPDWDEVDHEDGDGLNNCRSNLRDGAGFRNKGNTGMRSTNTSGFKGVSRKGNSGWQARITVNSEMVCLGTYDTPEGAADAYDRAAVRHFGEYAKTNAMMGQVAAEDVRSYRPPVRGGHFCPPGCTCRKHVSRIGRGKLCPPGCTCGRHRRKSPHPW
jgi:hypothetical protein